MCVVCLLINKEKITKPEALKALWEQVNMVESEEEIKHIQKIYSDLEAAIEEEDK